MKHFNNKLKSSIAEKYLCGKQGQKNKDTLKKYSYTSIIKPDNFLDTVSVSQYQSPTILQSWATPGRGSLLGYELIFLQSLKHVHNLKSNFFKCCCPNEMDLKYIVN